MKLDQFSTLLSDINKTILSIHPNERLGGLIPQQILNLNAGRVAARRVRDGNVLL